MKLNYYIIVGMIILKVLDILTTIFALQLDGIIESNPFWYEYEDNPFMIFILSFWVILVILVLTLIFRNQKFIIQIIMALFLFYGIALIYVVINNIYLIFLYI